MENEKFRETIEIPVYQICVDDATYELILADGIDAVETDVLGFNIQKHSWHEYRDETDGIVINILVAEAFADIEEGEFLRLVICRED